MAAPPGGSRAGSRPPADGRAPRVPLDGRSPRVPAGAVRRPPPTRPPLPPLPARPAGGAARGPVERHPLDRVPAGRPPVEQPRREPAAREPAGPEPAPRYDAARRPPADRPLVGPRRTGPRVTAAPGRLRRFVLRYGWRAYAIPLLTVATLLTLVDLARSGSAAQPSDRPDAAQVSAVSSPDAGAAADPGTPTPTAPAEGEAAPTGAPAPAAGTYVEQGAGTVTVVPGTSEVHGTGPLRRFVVEVEDGIGVDGPTFAAAVEATLADPRSWGAGGRMSFQRVGVDEEAAGDFDFRVTLISPGNMETYCPGVGTGGYTSCRYGDRAVINLARWETAVPDYQGDVATYRQYVVNHEVGHALGNGHEQCPGPGLPAPVMQQQTLGLQGCAKNAWPHP